MVVDAVVAEGVTVKATGTVTEGAPVAYSVTTPLWVPAVRVPVVTLMVTVPVPVPVPGVCDSQVASWLTLQGSVPPPVLLMARVWAAGLLLPCWAVKDRLGGLSLMADGTGAAVTVKATGIVTGVAPDALRIMVSL